MSHISLEEGSAFGVNANNQSISAPINSPTIYNILLLISQFTYKMFSWNCIDKLLKNILNCYNMIHPTPTAEKSENILSLWKYTIIKHGN